MALIVLISDMALFRWFDPTNPGEKNGVESTLKTLSKTRDLPDHNQVGVLTSEVDNLSELFPNVQQRISHFDLEKIPDESLRTLSSAATVIILFWIIPTNQLAVVKRRYEANLGCSVTIWTLEDLKNYLDKSQEGNQAAFYPGGKDTKPEDGNPASSFISSIAAKNTTSVDGTPVSSFTSARTFNVGLWLFALALLNLGLSSEKSDDIDRGALVPGAKVPNPPNPTGEGASEPADKFLADAITSSQLALATNLVNLVQGNGSNTLVIEEVEDTLINVIFRSAAFDVSTVSLDTFLVGTATVTSDQALDLIISTADGNTSKEDLPAIATDQETEELPTGSNPTGSEITFNLDKVTSRGTSDPIIPKDNILDHRLIEDGLVHSKWHPPVGDFNLHKDPIVGDLPSIIWDIITLILVYPIVPGTPIELPIGTSGETPKESPGSTIVPDPPIISGGEIPGETPEDDSSSVPGDDNSGELPIEDVPVIISPSSKEINCLGGKYEVPITSEDGQITILNFGGVGKGTDPKPEIINEIDTLKFVGDRFTARNMVLFESNRDLIIRFEGVPNTEIVLKGFALQNLDNFLRPQASGVFANILFNGQAVVQDGKDDYDVVDAEWNNGKVLSKNKVTFLNAKDNVVSGYDSSADVINGQDGNDTLLGLSGNDLLRGGLGNDTLRGGWGDDILIGGEGRNEITGNEGLDQFGISLNGFSQVNDFQSNQDFIKLLDGINIDQLIIQQGTGTYSNDTWIKLGNNPLMLLKGVSASTLGSDRFLSDL